MADHLNSRCGQRQWSVPRQNPCSHRNIGILKLAPLDINEALSQVWGGVYMHAHTKPKCNIHEHTSPNCDTHEHTRPKCNIHEHTKPEYDIYMRTQSPSVTHTSTQSTSVIHTWTHKYKCDTCMNTQSPSVNTQAHKARVWTHEHTKPECDTHEHTKPMFIAHCLQSQKWLPEELKK